MRITLKELIAEVAHLPWHNVGTSGTGITLHSKLPDGVSDTDAIATVKMAAPSMTRSHATYLVHAANVLPELVEALREMINEKVEGPFFHEDEHTEGSALWKAREALAKASTIEVPQ